MRICQTISKKTHFYFSGSIYEGFKFLCGRSGTPSVTAAEIREFFQRFRKGEDYFISTTRTKANVKTGSMGHFLYETGAKKSCRASYFAATLLELGYIRVHGEKRDGYQFTIVHVPDFPSNIIPIRPTIARNPAFETNAVAPALCASASL